MSGIPYGVILLAATVVLAVRYAGIGRASLRSKWAVAWGAVASALSYPVWPLAALVLQFGICLYVIFYQLVTADLAESDEGKGSE